MWSPTNSLELLASISLVEDIKTKTNNQFINLSHFHRGIEALRRTKLLNLANLNSFMHFPQCEEISLVLEELSDLGFLSQSHFNLLMANPGACVLLGIFSLLNKQGLLNPSNYARILSFQDQNSLACILEILFDTKLLSAENLELVCSQHNHLLIDIARISQNLQVSLQLNQENFIRIMRHGNPSNLSVVIHILKEQGFLHQTYLDLLLQPKYALLCSFESIEMIWQKLSPRQFARHCPLIFELAATAVNCQNLIERFHALTLEVEPVLNFFHVGAGSAALPKPPHETVTSGHLSFYRHME
jgi:hypothetical protein